MFDYYGRPRNMRFDTLPAEIVVHITKNSQQPYLNISASSSSSLSLLPVGSSPAIHALPAFDLCPVQTFVVPTGL